MSRRYRAAHADEGATLILVLLIVGVVSALVGVLLTQADTGIRSTVQLRDQAADYYGADGATQAVLTGLRTSGIDCSDPANPAGVTLGSTGTPFYVPVSSEQGPVNAYAQCTADALKGVTSSTSQPPPSTAVNTVTPAPVTSTGAALGAGDPTLPSYALLTTGNTANDFGIDFSNSASNKTICVENGSVGSNKNIDLYGASQRTGLKLSVRLSGTGNPSDCTTGTGVSSSGSRLIVTAEGQCITDPAGTGGFTPTPCTPSSPDVATPPAPTLPSTPVADNAAALCKTTGTTTYAALAPGRYTDVTQLNAPCPSPARNLFVWLRPGTFYFDFGTTQWAWPNTLLAGTPIDSSGNPVPGLDGTKAATLDKLANAAPAPNACADPAPIGSTAQGSQLVFGGASTVLANSAGAAELCATASATSPPLAIYGLNNPVTVPRTTGGSVTIPAETLCSPASGCGSSSLINTDQSGQPVIYIKGYVYAPNAQMILTLKNSPGQVFNWGIVIRDFRLTVNGVSPAQAFIDLPRPTTGVGVITTTSTPPPYPTTTVSTPPPTTIVSYTIRYVNVWICTVASLQQSGQDACAHTGTPDVQARVQVSPDGTLTVLSWNHIG
jgi:hypothetical protein